MKRDRTALDPRPRRIVDGYRAKMEQQEARFIEVLRVISSASSLDLAQRFAGLAADGLEPGSIEWRWTTVLIDRPASEGFCVTCGKGFEGECQLEMFEDACPAEIGAVRYAGCSADG